MVIRSIYAGVTLYNGYTVVNKYNIVGYVQIPDWQVLTRGSVVTLLYSLQHDCAHLVFLHMINNSKCIRGKSHVP